MSRPAGTAALALARSADWQRLVADLAASDPAALRTRDEKLAFWVNAPLRRSIRQRIRVAWSPPAVGVALLRIREEQVDALGEVGRARFVEQMIDHLYAFCPELCRTLEQDVIRSCVWQAIERAEAYSLVCRGSMRLFLEAMVLLGAQFDADPQYPWAREVLLRDDFPNEMFKSGRLEHLLRDYVEKVNGAENENALAALRKLEDLAGNPAFVFREEMLAADIQNALRVAFPAKLRHVEQAAVDAIIRRAAQLSQEVYAARQARPTAVLAILMFAFGAGCAEDPFYPWIGATLRDAKIMDDASRASRLERKALTWLNAVLEGAGAAAPGRA